MHSILLVDDQEIFRSPLAEALREQGYDVREAGTAPQALEMAMRSKPDLMLLDLAMPNIDGFELLRYFRGRAVFRTVPVIFLTAYARRDYLMRAASMGVKDYMLKSSFSLKDLLERIEAHLETPYQPKKLDSSLSASSAIPASAVFSDSRSDASESATGVVAGPLRHQRREFLDNIAIRSFPSAVTDILSLASDPNSSLGEIEAVLRRDPGLVAQVMVMANSATFRRGGFATNLEEALRTLGMSQVVRIVSSVSILKPDELASVWGRDLRRMWSHSLATGMICQRFQEPAQEAFGFLLGLLHDLPELLCMAHLREDWIAWKAQGVRYGWNLSTTLGKAFETDFVEIARDVIAAMRLPETLGAPIREYHEFYLADRPMEPHHHARSIEAAHEMAVVLGRSGCVLAHVAPLRTEQMRRFHEAASIGRDLLPLDAQIAQWETISGMREDPVSEFPGDLLRVVYWRSDAWFSPDPIEILLQKICRAQRVDLLEELDGDADLKILLADPGTPEWDVALRLRGRVLVMHRTSLGNTPLKTLRAMRLPITEAMLTRLFDDL